MSGYGDQSYWNKRYSESKDAYYDWYMSYDSLKDEILNRIPEHKDSGKNGLKLLVVGCGNSQLSNDMFEDGFSDIISIDYSEPVINKMREEYKDKPALRFETMDVREMTFEDNSFDVIVDKGTLDAILCGNDSGENSSRMLQDIQRVLRPGGHFFVITYGQPQSRLDYLDKPTSLKWAVDHCTVGKTRFMYHMHMPMEEGTAAREEAPDA